MERSFGVQKRCHLHGCKGKDVRWRVGPKMIETMAERLFR